MPEFHGASYLDAMDAMRAAAEQETRAARIDRESDSWIRTLREIRNLPEVTR